MTMDSPRRAWAALAVLVAGADGVGTLTEGRFLLETMADLPVFGGMDRKAFARLLGDVADEACARYPTDGEGRFTDEGTAALLRDISGTLDAEDRRDAYRLASDLANADGVTPSELETLRRVRKEFGLEAGDES